MILTKSKLLILFFGFVSVYIIFNLDKWERKRVLQWDIAGYYLYLPATFIYGDTRQLSWYPAIDSAYNLSEEYGIYAVNEVPGTGNKVAKYPIGTAIFELPFFLGAHAFTCLSHDYPPDGYSPPYALAICLATVFWVLCGLFILRKVLLTYYSEEVVFVTILLIAFGTNLYNYTAFDWGMSHSFSFFLFSAFLYCTRCWYVSGQKKYLLLLGALLGWIVITRPTNIIIVLLPLLWPYGAIKVKLAFIKQHFAALILSFVLFLMIISIQLAYWKYATGHWYYDSYPGEGFNFLQPRIWKGLFSYRKGWFIYTPLALLVIPGFILLYKRRPTLVLPLLSFFVINLYIVFSWHQWYYGGSFSARALLESIAIFSMPIAACSEWLMLLHAKKVRKWILALMLLLVMLNIFQTYQFSHGVIKADGMTREHYWQHFFDIE